MKTDTRKNRFSSYDRSLLNCTLLRDVWKEMEDQWGTMELRISGYGVERDSSERKSSCNELASSVSLDIEFNPFRCLFIFEYILRWLFSRVPLPSFTIGRISVSLYLWSCKPRKLTGRLNLIQMSLDRKGWTKLVLRNLGKSSKHQN